MISHVQQTLRRHSLIRPGDHVVAAVSGGADSMALALVLRELGVRFTAAHLDHGLRDDSASDARFVADTLSEWGIDCVIERVDVGGLTEGAGRSLEMVAREARYRFLTRTAEQVGARVIATGHTRDDQAETVLLKLARGAGAHGLAGIPRRGKLGACILVRPLRDCSRTEVEAYLRERGIAWREDASNRDPAFLRNRVRHEVLPMLERALNPLVRDALVRTGEVLGEEDRLLQAVARRRLRECLGEDGEGLDRIRWMRLSPALRRRVLLLWLGRQGVPAEALTFVRLRRVEDLAATGEGSAEAPLADGWGVRRDYDWLTVSEAPAEAAEVLVTVAVPGSAAIPAWGIRIEVSRDLGFGKATGGECWLNADAVGDEVLTVRSRRSGDRMRPAGMTGTVRLQDVFVDRKIPRAERDRVPVVECRGEVAWVSGYRVARGWEVPDVGAPSVRVRLVAMPADETG